MAADRYETTANDVSGAWEVGAQKAWKTRIESTFGWRVHIPQRGESVEVPL